MQQHDDKKFFGLFKVVEDKAEDSFDIKVSPVSYIPDLKGELNKNKESYECQYCKNKIENKSAKVKHEKQCDFNTNKQIRIYFCQYCDKEFIKSKLNLVKHEKYYCELNPDSKKPEFKCVCGKIYSDKGNFAQHQKKCELRVNS